jgi:hypothetical protein
MLLFLIIPVLSNLSPIRKPENSRRFMIQGAADRICDMPR